MGRGLGSSFLVDPARDLVVIVLTQRLWETAQPPAVHTELQARPTPRYADRPHIGEVMATGRLEGNCAEAMDFCQPS